MPHDGHDPAIGPRTRRRPFGVHEYRRHGHQSSGLEAARKLGLSRARRSRRSSRRWTGALGVAVRARCEAELDLQGARGKRAALRRAGRAPSGRPAARLRRHSPARTAQALRSSPTPRRSHTRRSTSAPAGAGSSSSSSARPGRAHERGRRVAPRPRLDGLSRRTSVHARRSSGANRMLGVERRPQVRVRFRKAPMVERPWIVAAPSAELRRRPGGIGSGRG